MPHYIRGLRLTRGLIITITTLSVFFGGFGGFAAGLKPQEASAHHVTGGPADWADEPGVGAHPNGPWTTGFLGGVCWYQTVFHTSTIALTCPYAPDEFSNWHWHAMNQLASYIYNQGDWERDSAHRAPPSGYATTTRRGMLLPNGNFVFDLILYTSNWKWGTPSQPGMFIAYTGVASPTGNFIPMGEQGYERSAQVRYTP